MSLTHTDLGHGLRPWLIWEVTEEKIDISSIVEASLKAKQKFEKQGNW